MRVTFGHEALPDRSDGCARPGAPRSMEIFVSSQGAHPFCNHFECVGIAASEKGK